MTRLQKIQTPKLLFLLVKNADFVKNVDLDFAIARNEA